MAGGVGVDQAASRRGVERHPQGGTDAMQGGRGAGPAVAGWGAGQDRERGLYVVQAQLAQHDPTEVGIEVVVDVLVVAAQCGGPVPKASGQPVPQPLPGAQQHPVRVGGMRSTQPVSAQWASARVR
ncbi:MAG: hypothetical protein ACRDQG_10405 [Pseudonocardiaceae bacterium]